MKKVLVFRLLLIAIPIVAIVGLDIAVGYYQETASIKKSRRLFLEEVSLLRTNTLNMVPSLDHAYKPIGEPEAIAPNRVNSVRYLRTNKDGLIIPSSESLATIGTNKPTSILFLGGSTTECNEVHEPFRFPAVVESLLSKAGNSVHVSNAGVRGHTTQDSINALLNRSGFRDHDIVVLLHNINDRLRLAIHEGYQVQLGTVGQGTFKAVNSSLVGLGVSLWDWASLRSNILHLSRPILQNIGSKNDEKPGVVVDERVINFRHHNHKAHLEVFRTNLRVFVATVKALGKKPVLMTQALGANSGEQNDFNTVIREVSVTENIPVIDLARLLGKDPSWAFLSDGIHLNSAGSSAVGYLIAKQLAGDFKFSGEIDRQYLESMPTSPQDLLSRCLPQGSELAKPGAARRILGRTGRYPSFSPDGKLLLFHSFNQERKEYLMAFDLATASYFQLSDEKISKNERHPAFLSYDDKGFSVVFGSSDGQGTFEHLKIRTWPSKETIDLTTGPLGGSIPAVQGRSVYFAGYEAGGPSSVPNIYRYDLNSKSTEQITKSSSEHWRPAVSPDGTIYFIASTASMKFDLYRLTSGSKTPEVVFSSKEDEWDPAVAPDGRLVAFASKSEGNWNIYLGAKDNLQNARQITFLPGDSWDPSFDPTGRMLVFASAREYQPYVYGLCIFGERASRNAMDRE
jgi:lysophospholipase L1-like esterase